MPTSISRLPSSILAAALPDNRMRALLADYRDRMDELKLLAAKDYPAARLGLLAMDARQLLGEIIDEGNAAAKALDQVIEEASIAQASLDAEPVVQAPLTGFAAEMFAIVEPYRPAPHLTLVSDRVAG